MEKIQGRKAKISSYLKLKAKIYKTMTNKHRNSLKGCKKGQSIKIIYQINCRNSMRKLNKFTMNWRISRKYPKGQNPQSRKEVESLKISSAKSNKDRMNNRLDQLHTRI